MIRRYWRSHLYLPTSLDEFLPPFTHIFLCTEYTDKLNLWTHIWHHLKRCQLVPPAATSLANQPMGTFAGTGDHSTAARFAKRWGNTWQQSQSHDNQWVWNPSLVCAKALAKETHTLYRSATFSSPRSTISLAHFGGVRCNSNQNSFHWHQTWTKTCTALGSPGIDLAWHSHDRQVIAQRPQRASGDVGSQSGKRPRDFNVQLHLQTYLPGQVTYILHWILWKLIHLVEAQAL